MSVVNVTLKWSGGAVLTEVGRREVTRVYDVLHDTPVDADVLSVGSEAIALGLPNIGDPFSALDTALTCQRIGGARMLGPMLAEVPVTFIAEGSQDEGSDPTTDPQSIEVAWGFSSVIETVNIDLDNRPIASFHGEFYDPGMNVEKKDVTLAVIRNEWLYDPQMVVSMHDSINTNDLPTFGVVAGQARLRIQPVGLVNESSGTPLVRMRYDLTFRKGVEQTGFGVPAGPAGGPARAWYRRVAHVGFRGVPLFQPGDPPPGPEPVELKDTQGNRLSTPAKLGPFGEQLPAAAPQYFLEFRQNELRNFAPLQLEGTYLLSKWGQITGSIGL